MDPEFLNVDGEHEHDDSVSSLSIVADGDVDFESFQNWIGDILREKAADIYRMKGVMSVGLSTKKFVYQAVHMIFNGDFGESWTDGEKRHCKLVFIGKNLDKEGLEKGWRKFEKLSKLMLLFSLQNQRFASKYRFKT